MQSDERKDEDALDLRFLAVVGALALLVVLVSHAALWLMKVG